MYSDSSVNIILRDAKPVCVRSFNSTHKYSTFSVNNK